jgi:methylated-DNA-[protein]-cysteine S-methyltransferase
VAAGSALFSTPLGTCGLAWTARGISHTQLPLSSDELLRQRMTRHGPLSDPPAAVAAAVRRIQGHLDGQPDPLHDLRLDLGALSPFARQVSGRLRRVGPGQTTTYGELGRGPGAARAVGGAMANNPLPLVVPCHRVLASGGGLGGFSAHGGLRTKLRLLTLEGADLRPIAAAGQRVLKRADPVLAGAIRRAPRFPLADRTRQDPFFTLAQSIVHQQVSMKAGATIFGRLRALARDRRGRLSPRRLLSASDVQLRGVGLSRQKAGYLRDLAARTSDGSLPLGRLERMDDGAVIAALTAVKGIGVWSAEMFLMFHLGRLDVLPVGDLGLRKGAKQLYGLDGLPGPEELRDLARPWVPFRSVATWAIWRGLDAGGI